MQSFFEYLEAGEIELFKEFDDMKYDFSRHLIDIIIYSVFDTTDNITEEIQENFASNGYYDAWHLKQDQLQIEFKCYKHRKCFTII